MHSRSSWLKHQTKKTNPINATCIATVKCLQQSYKSSSDRRSWSSRYMLSAICHTWNILSSVTLAKVHGSFLFHEKSDIPAVWPLWTNNNSGGPSSASSGVCSSPILWRRMENLTSIQKQMNLTLFLGSPTKCWPKKQIMLNASIQKKSLDRKKNRNFVITSTLQLG